MSRAHALHQPALAASAGAAACDAAVPPAVPAAALPPPMALAHAAIAESEAAAAAPPAVPAAAVPTNVAPAAVQTDAAIDFGPELAGRHIRCAETHCCCLGRLPLGIGESTLPLLAVALWLSTCRVWWGERHDWVAGTVKQCIMPDRCALHACGLARSEATFAHLGAAPRTAPSMEPACSFLLIPSPLNDTIWLQGADCEVPGRGA